MIKKIILLIFLIIIWLFLYKICKIESFNNYKSLTVTLTSDTINPKIISTFEKNSLYYEYGNTLSKLFPLNVISSSGSVENIHNLVNNKAQIILTQENVVLKYINKYPFLRYIYAPFNEKSFLVSNPVFKINSWKDLKGKTVCFGNKDSGSCFDALTLCKLINIDKSQLNIIYGDISDKYIQKLVNNNTIGAFYFTGEDPYQILIDITKNKTLNIIGSRGLPHDLVSATFPTWKKSSIILSNYNLPKKFNVIPCYSLRSVLITTKYQNYNSIYRFLDTLIKNRLHIHSSIKNNTYKLVLDRFSFQKSFSNHPVIPLHKAVYDYYKDIGLISTNPSIKCIHFAGSGECNLDFVH